MIYHVKSLNVIQNMEWRLFPGERFCSLGKKIAEKQLYYCSQIIILWCGVGGRYDFLEHLPWNMKVFLETR